MWQYLFILLAALSVSALPSAPEYEECKKDDLYKSLKDHGTEFCTKILDPECYSSITTPVEYATIDGSKLSFYCSCVLEPCHHSTTTSTVTVLPTTGRTNSTTTSTSLVTTVPQNTTSTTITDRFPTETTRSGPPWTSSNTTILTPTSSSVPTNSTTTIVLAPSTSSTTGNATVTTFPGNTTTSTVFTTSSAAPVNTTLLTPTSSSVQSNSTTTFIPTPITSSITGNGSVTTFPGNTTTSRIFTIVPVNTTLRTSTASSALANGTTTIAPVPSTSSTAGNATVTTFPGNTTTSQGFTAVPANTTLTTTTSSTSVNVTITIIPKPPTTSTTSNISSTTVPGNTTTSQIITTTTSSVVATPTPVFAANFTGVLRGPAPPGQVCHHLSEAKDGIPNVATLQNDIIRQRNLSLASPFISSVNFDSDSVVPLYLSLQDTTGGSYHIDVSSATAVSIFDAKNNSMRIDAAGIHFAAGGGCNLTVSYLVDDMYAQLAKMSREPCALGAKTKLISAGAAVDQSFVQTLFLQDQCNEPVKHTVRQYPDVRVDDDRCFSVGTDDRNGTWVFNCPWAGSSANVQKCISSLQRNAIEFLLYDPFNGGCADVSSVITLLEGSAQDLFGGESLRQELYRQLGDNAALRTEADDIVVFYLQLWEMLKSTLSKTQGLNPSRGSNLKQYLYTYNTYRNFAEDACTSLNSSASPATLSLRAGSSTLLSVATFNNTPTVDVPIPARIQDPAKIACCPNGGTSITSPQTGACAYPPSALVSGTSCVCGQTAGGASVAFKYRQCNNFVSQCEADSDCNTLGGTGYLCLVGSCCGKGVCFDPFECSRAEVHLVQGSAT